MKRVLMMIAAGCLLLTALMIAAYPMIANYINNKFASEIRTEYEVEVKSLDNTTLQELRADAEAYNATLAPVQFSKEGLTAAETDYQTLLNPSGSGIMGYIEVPKLGINLPIYHGTGETVLEEGVGHLIGSSMPIGGEGCHCVLTGHSGMASKKLFSDLDQLAVGDMFYLKVLNDTLAYAVTDINIVLPHETELLELVQGEDLCTLVTCTPFGVNSHRLLVRGTRIPFQAAEEIAENADTALEEPVKSTWKEQYMLGLKIGSGIAGAALLFLVITLRWKRRKERL